MSTVQLNNLLQYLQSLSLTPSNRKWLAEQLYTPEEEKVTYTEAEFRDKIAKSAKSAKEGKCIRMAEGETSEQFINRMLCM